MSALEQTQDCEVMTHALAPCRVVQVMLTNFRTYGALSLACDAPIVVLTGPNGAGKTNVLEALSQLSPGRGLRSCTLSEMGRRQSGGDRSDLSVVPWAVGASVMGASGPVQLGAGFMPGQDAALPKKVIRINGITQTSAAAFEEYIQFVWLTPSHDRLFLEAASDRRRFLDKLIASFDLHHWRHWSAYEKAMRDRLSVLRDGRSDGAWLTSLERVMAEHAVALSAARREGIARLMQAMAAQRVEAFPIADLALDGDVETALSRVSALAAEDQFAERLHQSRQGDSEAGRTRIGPHLTDLLVRHRVKDRDARQCSTGEQKALMMAMVLAGAAISAQRRDAPPVLLLDEVVAHLDNVRRRALFETLDRLGVQCWMTGTDEYPFEALGARALHCRVTPGSVQTSSHAG